MGSARETLLCAAIFCISISVEAQEVELRATPAAQRLEVESAISDAIRRAIQRIGGVDIVRATGNLNLRASPPTGVLKQLGESKGIVRKNEILRIEQTEEVNTLLKGYEWVKVTRLCGDAVECVSEVGWVYNGESGEGGRYLERVSDDELVEIVTDPGSAWGGVIMDALESDTNALEALRKEHRR